ncbi:hypothetical protein NEOLI_004701 [Neolecta irregularis DAH-3]|uniref:DUF1746 domain-containing protein n=1 Tax=Neolecta irregularis (strain DAH-3) TaxID=1198029 RepID=A0A1U7LNB6_NEOID|nr:hypothetical protein NEOLI_004701 [Neolecta irregularis DAH-3]|eukprot:OLL24137.1 hypothetical protein NEOLI_004701 [Neolecta irregularis DAH-3]
MNDSSRSIIHSFSGKSRIDTNISFLKALNTLIFANLVYTYYIDPSVFRLLIKCYSQMVLCG